MTEDKEVFENKGENTEGVLKNQNTENTCKCSKANSKFAHVLKSGAFKTGVTIVVTALVTGGLTFAFTEHREYRNQGFLNKHMSGNRDNRGFSEEKRGAMRDFGGRGPGKQGNTNMKDKLDGLVSKGTITQADEDAVLNALGESLAQPASNQPAQNSSPQPVQQTAQPAQQSQ